MFSTHSNESQPSQRARTLFTSAAERQHHSITICSLKIAVTCCGFDYQDRTGKPRQTAAKHWVCLWASREQEWICIDEVMECVLLWGNMNKTTFIFRMKGRTVCVVWFGLVWVVSGPVMNTSDVLMSYKDVAHVKHRCAHKLPQPTRQVQCHLFAVFFRRNQRGRKHWADRASREFGSFVDISCFVFSWIYITQLKFPTSDLQLFQRPVRRSELNIPRESSSYLA